jgi:hypothetical protein
MDSFCCCESGIALNGNNQARQIGKSSLVRAFGKQFDNFVEINFEKQEHLQTKTVFEHSLEECYNKTTRTLFSTLSTTKPP